MKTKSKEKQSSIAENMALFELPIAVMAMINYDTAVSKILLFAVQSV